MQRSNAVWEKLGLETTNSARICCRALRLRSRVQLRNRLHCWKRRALNSVLFLLTRRPLRGQIVFSQLPSTTTSPQGHQPLLSQPSVQLSVHLSWVTWHLSARRSRFSGLCALILATCRKPPSATHVPLRSPGNSATDRPRREFGTISALPCSRPHNIRTQCPAFVARFRPARVQSIQDRLRKPQRRTLPPAHCIWATSRPACAPYKSP